MKNLKTISALALGTLVAAAALAADKPAYPAYSVPNSQIRVLPVTKEGRHYQLYIGLPGSYGTDATRRYPVVYVTDGYWDFAKITSIGGGLVYDRVVPEFITVGFGYAGDKPNYGDLRRWELSPAPVDDNGEASGHAADFRNTLEKSIIPMIDAEYRTDPHYRVMAGTSLGGLFTLYTMFTKPDLFQAYIAVTPAVIVGNDWLFKYEDDFAKANRPLRTRLYMTVGGNESPGYLNGVIRFNQRLAQRKRAGFVYDFRIVEGERHGGVPFDSYTRGLRFAFEPIAPETGPAPGN